MKFGLPLLVGDIFEGSFSGLSITLSIFFFTGIADENLLDCSSYSTEAYLFAQIFILFVNFQI